MESESAQISDESKNSKENFVKVMMEKKARKKHGEKWKYLSSENNRVSNRLRSSNNPDIVEPPKFKIKMRKPRQVRIPPPFVLFFLDAYKKGKPRDRPSDPKIPYKRRVTKLIKRASQIWRLTYTDIQRQKYIDLYNQMKNERLNSKGIYKDHRIGSVVIPRSPE